MLPRTRSSPFIILSFLLLSVSRIHAWTNSPAWSGDDILLNNDSLVGVWSLTSTTPLVQVPPKSLFNRQHHQDEYSALVHLNHCGNFQQCRKDDDEGYTEGAWISGKWWTMNSNNVIVLALNRQYYGPNFDIILRGQLVRDGETTVTIYGTISHAKFVLPKNHQDFGDRGVINTVRLGNFVLKQWLTRVTELRGVDNEGLLWSLKQQQGWNGGEYGILE